MEAEFRDAYNAGRGSLIALTGPADLITPVAAYLKLAQDVPYTFLLESIEGGVARGRYSIIGLHPDLIWRCQEGCSEINRTPQTQPEAFQPQPGLPLDNLRALIAETRFDVPDHLPPMAAGLVGYLGYDMVRQMEVLPGHAVDDLHLPEAILVRPGLFVIFDNVRDELTFAAPVYPRAGFTAEQAWRQAQDLVRRARTALDGPLPSANAPIAPISLPEPHSNMSSTQFLEIVARMKEYIVAGDVFQVVPSQRFSAPFPLSPLALYRALRRINPAPFLFHLNFGAFALVGSSPEILVRLRDGKITIRPLAGTRPRGASTEEDLALEAELLADPKERAEHLMLLDLGRNDVGRVARSGTVKVTESFQIERFSHVMHISSTVEGQIAPTHDALDALVAGFPAGTLTGAPKIRAMEIIDELEPTRRGVYAGCIGYFAADGTMDTCIGLRTALVKDGTMYVQAGCGVVADSNPQAEYEETRQKARALFRAAEEALRLAAQGPATHVG